MTSELHEKIDTLSDRVRKLEDALAETHTTLSNEPHPLLRQELLAIKRPLERDKYTSRSDNPVDEENADDENDTMASLWVPVAYSLVQAKALSLKVQYLKMEELNSLVQPLIHGYGISIALPLRR